MTSPQSAHWNIRTHLPSRDSLVGRTAATITPSLIYDDVPTAIDWLRRAFGSAEVFRVPGPSREVLYAELRYGQDFLMLETTPNNDLRLVSPRALEGRSHGVCVQVDDVETHLQTAEAAGARVVRSLERTDHGLQYSALDIEGHLWTFGHYAPGAK